MDMGGRKYVAAISGRAWKVAGTGFFLRGGVEGYIDSDPAKAGKKFNGKPVIFPEQLKELENVCVLINSIQPGVIKEISAYLDMAGREWYLMDEVILKSHRKEVLQCYDLLEDACSRNIYAVLALWRLTGRKPEMEIKCEEHTYFALEHFRQSCRDVIFKS